MVYRQSETGRQTVVNTRSTQCYDFENCTLIPSNFQPQPQGLSCIQNSGMGVGEPWTRLSKYFKNHPHDDMSFFPLNGFKLPVNTHNCILLNIIPENAMSQFFISILAALFRSFYDQLATLKQWALRTGLSHSVPNSTHP